MNCSEILKAIDKKLGPRPRSFNFIDKITWFKQDKPEWDWENDEIKHNVENWEKVFREGKLSWGHVVQVNTLMFEKSSANCPGEIIVWCEKESLFDLDAFKLVAEKLYELKGYSDYLDDTKEKEFAEYLENQSIRAHGIKVPTTISEGLNIRVCTVFFQRRHIPNGVITNSLFPILYLDSKPMVATIVPYQFWPKTLLIEWA